MAPGTIHRGRAGQWAFFAHRTSGFPVFFFSLLHVVDVSLVNSSPTAYHQIHQMNEHRPTSERITRRRAGNARSRPHRGRRGSVVGRGPVPYTARMLLSRGKRIVGAKRIDHRESEALP